MQRRSLIIAGTDTDAGKTLISAALLKQYAQDNDNLYYWKPVQTGYPKDDDTLTVKQLSGCSRIIGGLRFKEPLSPHLAAELEGQQIDEKKIIDEYQSQSHDLIIEGAGGLFVPLNRKTLWIDLLEQLQRPVLLVARTGLGTINHTLLSLEALQRRQIPVAGVAFFGTQGQPADDNVRTISEFSTLPMFGPIQHADLAEGRLLDSRKLLQPLLCH